MALRSLLLSLLLTIGVGYALTAGISNSDSPLRKLPDWTALPMLTGVFLLYLLAAIWAFRGFSEQKLAAIFSLGFCALGFGLYALAFAMETGRGKAAPGQYDYDFFTLDPREKVVLTRIAEEAGLRLEHATFTEHWGLSGAPAGFSVCVQQKHITALNFSGRNITDLSLFSHLPYLGDLYLNNCGLSNLSDLKLEKLDRLEVADNRIADIKTLLGCPNIRFLGLKNNAIASLDDFELFPKLVSKDLSGNPVVN